MESNHGLLPADMLLKIFSYFPYKDLVKFQFVCTWWQQVSRDKCLWRDIVYKPDYNDNTQEIIDNLKASPELRALDLSDVKCSAVTRELVVEIANECPRLEQLSLLWDSLCEFHMEIKKIKILIMDKKLTLDYSILDFEHLHNCFPNVEHLDCNPVNLLESGIKTYLRKKGRSLHTLGIRCEMSHDLGNPWEMYSDCTLQYLSMCPNLRTLRLFRACDEGECLPVESVENLKQILSLTLKYSCWSADSHMSLFAYFPNLVVLELENCFLQYDSFLIIAMNCPLLEKLTDASPASSDDNIMYISNFKKLTYLCLKGYRITDDCVPHLQAILELRYLDISHCERLTPHCLLALCSFPKLQTLKFDLRNRDPPAELCASHVKNPHLHIQFYNCKDTCVLHHLRSRRLRISLL